MKFSALEHVRAQPTLHDLPWSDLIDLLSVFTFRQVKVSGACFSPAEFDGRGMKNENVIAIHFGVLDVDGQHLPDGSHGGIPVDQLLDMLKLAEPYAAFFYPSWQSPAAASRNAICGRLLVPFTRPVSPQEWAALWPKFNAAFGGLADTQCTDARRVYFTPALPAGCEWAAQTWRSAGTGAWDVDAALAAPLVSEPAAPDFVAADPVPKEALARLAQSLSRRAEPNAIRMGMLIRAGLDGYSLANPGARDTTLFQIASTLAECFPHGDASALAEHFRLSLGLMAQQAPECPTLEQFTEKISRAQKKLAAQRAHVEQAGANARSRKIAIAWRGAGYPERSSPYTPEELAAFAQSDATAGPLQDRWIVQHSDRVYIHFAGSYVGPFARSAIPSACAQWLAPAVTAGVELYEIDDKGAIKVKPLERLISEYGQIVRAVEADMTADSAYLAADRAALVEAPCPLRRDLEPAFDADVHDWLALLSGCVPLISGGSVERRGGKFDALLDWIACVTRLRYPAPALYLKGEPGTGKSLLAFGLARLWNSNHPTTLRSAMATFNAEIARCPLVLADEKIPESWSGTPRTEELRELITTTEFSINRKFQDLVTCRGSLRIMLCANNLKLISAREDFTPEDAQALADRFLFVTPHPAARAWLEQRGGQRFTGSLVEGDRIARHALWLRAEAESGRRPITPGGRLVVPGDSSELLKLLRAGSGLRWSILFWIHSFLRDPAVHVAACAGRPLGALVREGRVWISPKFLAAYWDHYLQNERPPTLERLAIALKGMLLPVRDFRYQPRNARGTGARYQAVDTGQIEAWCELQSEDVSDLPAMLAIETESIGVGQLPGMSPGARSN